MNDENIVVSIACLAYNHASYISQCLDNVLFQKTDFLFEILIHDDASIDGTSDIIRNYEANYPNIIKPIYQTDNQYSKNIDVFGINVSRARGKYIAICEGDDYWTDPYKLQKQVDFLESHPDYSFSHTSFQYLNCESGSLKESKEENGIIKELQKGSLDDIGENILNNNTYRIQTMTVVFRRELYNKVVESDKFLYQSGYFMMGDTQLWLGLLSYGKLHFLEDNTSVYRIHNSSVCRPLDVEKKIRFNLSCCEMQVYMLSKHQYSKQLKYRLKKKYYITLWKYLVINSEFTPKIKFWPVVILSCTMRNKLIRYFSKLIFSYKYRVKISN